MDPSLAASPFVWKLRSTLQGMESRNEGKAKQRVQAKEERQDEGDVSITETREIIVVMLGWAPLDH